LIAHFFIAICCLSIFCFSVQTAVLAQEPRVEVHSGFAPIPSEAQFQGSPAPFTEITLDILLAIRNPEEYVRYFQGVRVGKRLPPAEETKLIESFQIPVSDYDAVVNWLSDQGIRMLYMDRENNRQLIRVTGQVERLEEAFGVKFVDIILGGKRYTAAQNQPTLPQSISRHIRTVSGFYPYKDPEQIESTVIKQAPK
jgi:hypothetical protein